MQFRQPSSALAATNWSSIRRRSGAWSLSPDGPGSATQDDAEQTAPVADRDRDVQPTIQLVRSSESPPSPHVPILPSFASDTTQEDDSTDPDNGFFSYIPLTPRSDAPSRAASESSDHTSASSISRLPTPDFTSPCRNEHPTGIRSFLTRGLSFVSLHKPKPVSFHAFSARSLSALVAKRPESVRSESDTSEGSHAGSTSSVDSGHYSLIPSVGTTERFTHKWPRPRSLRYLDIRQGRGTEERVPYASLGGEAAATMALEEGQGLGMNRVEKWSAHKWCLMLSVITVFIYGAAGLACAVLTWFRTWDHADVMYVADFDILVLITLSSSILVFVALVGATGALLNSRQILAVYTLLLWPAFISMLAIGYTAYRRSTFSLDHKLNLAWSQYYTSFGRLLIQDSLKCCGFYDALHEATPSKRCYSRTSLPGCKGKLYRFERENLALIWSTTFSLVPMHVANMVVALLTANHMANTFGKGIMPKRYRLSGTDVRVDAERLFGRNGGVVKRPDMSKASSSSVFRMDREERRLLDDYLIK